MTATLLALLLSQSTPDAFGRGLLHRLAVTCAPAESSTLTLKVAAMDSLGDGGVVTRWKEWPVSQCRPPRGRPFSLIASALTFAATEEGPIGAEVVRPDIDAEDHVAFAKLVGVPYPKPSQPGELPKYSPKLIRTVFDRVYRKPDQDVGGVRAQLVYDVIFKDRVRAEVKEWVLFLGSTTPRQRSDLAKAYAAAARRPDFESFTHLSGVAKQVAPELSLGGFRVAGIILRRSADGTLPTVLNLWVRVLDDYDPELAKETRAALLRAAAQRG
ncbi:MAG: hypothetical protein MUC96_20020 [Myxococcaceae bacterium]|jgi:hypothetical protein|nr:hypothetical protein [Myxococcaceae bacterium]